MRKSRGSKGERKGGDKGEEGVQVGSVGRG